MEETLWIDSLARGEERRKGEALPHSDTPGMKKSLSTVKKKEMPTARNERYPGKKQKGNGSRA